jgi:hypothetical protein
MITVVVGIPRSGTSLMMNLLKHAGVPILSNEAARPDRYNPDGYFEWSEINELTRLPGIIDFAEGKAIKVLSHQALYLPPGREYKFIFMVRDLHEVMASQVAFVGKPNSITQHNWQQAFDTLRHVRAAVKRRLTTLGPILFVDYNDLVYRPTRQCETVLDFLGLPYDNLTQMVAVVKPQYQHQRSVIPKC